MRATVSRVLLLLFYLSLIEARPASNDNAIGIIWTFPNEAWIVNLAVRQNSQILATSLSRYAIYLIDPFEHTAEVVHQFTPGNGVLGITETEPDLFVFATADVNLKTSTAVFGSAKILKLDMTTWDLDREACVSLISNLTDAVLPDGVVHIPLMDLVLVADAANGVAWRVDTITGDYEIAITNEEFEPSNPIIPLGIDAIHIADETLYFTNLGSNLLGRVSIDIAGHAIGPVENVTTVLSFPDDFALSANGTAYVRGGNTLWRVDPDGIVKKLAGGINDTMLGGVTLAQFGWTSIDKNVLYLGTKVGMLAPVDGIVHGGQTLAVNVDVLT